MSDMRLPVRGCRDVRPSLAAKRRAMIDMFGKLAQRFGFAEVEVPLLERAEMYTTALGATSDVVSAEMFRVHGPVTGSLRPPGDRSELVLRPEGTAGIARAFGSQASLGSDGARVWYSGPMFRYERPQRLRLRQFTQVGVECIGEASVVSDFDCIALAQAFLDRTPGGKESSLVLNTLGTREDRKAYNAVLSQWLAPRYLSLSFISRQRYEAGNCLRILDSKLPEDEDVMRCAPRLQEYISDADQCRFLKLQEYLRSEGIQFQIDHCLVRGLDYYSSTAFEFVDGSGQAVCAGGRYEQVQGSNGVGFAAGIERLEASQRDGEPSEEVECDNELQGGVRGGTAVILIRPTSCQNETSGTGSIGASGKEERVAFEVLRRLRENNMCALLRPVRGNRVGKTIGRAVRSGARAIVIVGPDDVAAGVVQVKLVAGTTHEARQDQLTVCTENVVRLIEKHMG